MYYLDSNGFILSSNTNTSSGYHGVVTDPGRFDWRAAINVPTQFRHYMPADNPVLILQSNNSIAHLANVVRTFYYDKVDTIGWESAIREVYRVGHGNWGLDIITSIIDLDLDRHGVSLARVVNRLRRSVVIDNRIGEKFIREIYKSYIPSLKKFGRDVVLSDIKILTVNEFSLRYGLPLR